MAKHRACRREHRWKLSSSRGTHGKVIELRIDTERCEGCGQLRWIKKGRLLGTTQWIKVVEHTRPDYSTFLHSEEE